MWVLVGQVTHHIFAGLYIQKVSKLPSKRATREIALSWFRRYRSFANIVSGKSYAASVKTNVKKSNVVVDSVKNLDTKHSVKNSVNKSIPCGSVRDYPVSAAKQSCKLSTVAGVPVKYGKCVPAKCSVQVPISTVPLHNKFQCLQNLCDSQNVVIHDVVYSVLSAKFSNKNHAKQHSEECKSSPSRSYDML